MKKIKFLPSVLMLVLSVAVLTLGVYAAKTSTNTVTGQITVEGSVSEVSIDVLVNGETVKSYATVRAGVDIYLPDLTITTEEANTIDEIPPTILTFAITNKSTTQELGAYFYEAGSEVAEDGYAPADNIDIDGSLKNQNGVDSVDYVASSYAHIGVASNENTYDNRDMSVWFYAKSFDPADMICDFAFTLKLEPWVKTTTSGQRLVKGNNFDGAVEYLALSPDSDYTFADLGDCFCDNTTLKGVTFAGATTVGFGDFQGSSVVSVDIENISGLNCFLGFGNNVRTTTYKGGYYLSGSRNAYKILLSWEDEVELHENLEIFREEDTSVNFNRLVLFGEQISLINDTVAWDGYFEIITLVVKGEDGLQSYSLPRIHKSVTDDDPYYKWYLTPDFSGDPVTSTTPSTKAITYYAKLS